MDVVFKSAFLQISCLWERQICEKFVFFRNANKGLQALTYQT